MRKARVDVIGLARRYRVAQHPASADSISCISAPLDEHTVAVNLVARIKDKRQLFVLFMSQIGVSGEGRHGAIAIA